MDNNREPQVPETAPPPEENEFYDPDYAKWSPDEPVSLRDKNDVYKDPFFEDPYNLHGGKEAIPEIKPVAKTIDFKKEKKKLILLTVFSALLTYPVCYILWHALSIIPIPIFFIFPDPRAPILIICLTLFVLTTIKLVHYSSSINPTEGGKLSFKGMFFYLPFSLILMFCINAANKYVIIALLLLSVVPFVMLCIKANRPIKKLFIPFMAILFLITVPSTFTHSAMFEKTITFYSEYYIISESPQGTDSLERAFVKSERPTEEYFIHDQFLTAEEQFNFAFHNYTEDNNRFLVIHHDDFKGYDNYELNAAMSDKVKRSVIKYDSKFFQEYDVVVTTIYSEYPIADIKITDAKENKGNLRLNVNIVYPSGSKPDGYRSEDVAVALLRVPKGTLNETAYTEHIDINYIMATTE